MTQWQNALARPESGQHIAQVCQDEDFLVEALSHFVRTGLIAGDGVVVFATARHWEACVGRLASSGVSPQMAESRGQLAVMDPRIVLSSFMADGMPDWKAFQDVVGTVINLTRRKYPRVRAYSGMANVLWQRGQRAAAVRLEALWNHLVKVQDLVLCCAYHVDVLAEESYGGALEEAFGLHTHLVPARDYEALEARVNDATDAVLGTPLAGMLRALAAAHPPRTAMPDAQATILWMKRHLPITAGKMLSRMRGEQRRAARRVTADAH